jgi:hypothetical protein
MLRVITTLALALCLPGCGSSGGVPQETSGGVPLITTDDNPNVCTLTYFVRDVIADPTFGTVDKGSGEPLKWPAGFTGRWVGTEVEVVHPFRGVLLTTPGRYRLSPTSYGGGDLAICDASPCPECGLGETGPL